MTFRVRHTPETAIGGAAELVCRSLTGEPPGGWGTSEPATTVWRLEDLAEMFGSRVGGGDCG